MESMFHFVSPPSQCTYLPDEEWEMEYHIVANMTAAEYAAKMQQGWRRFGHALFQPRCSHCQACQSLRISVPKYEPNRSQRRAWKANQHVRLMIGAPSATRAKLELYDRYHAFQSDFKGWPGHDPKSLADYVESFVANPFPTEEWCYYEGDKLVGVGYVDALPVGLSAIYFYYDPDTRDRSPGTFNVMRILHEAARRKLPWVYLGYYVENCRSLAYKSKFLPNQVYRQRQGWIDYRTMESPGESH
ncbi:arginyltransferase [Tuwongella immobilis]|uniref:Aspartate/glutamate leucyltransferase n=1 Tax=Tuwongella immobilis TaxID=692036 RepID=A0A6C2YTX4_9BACT|nr:arginyltransferase [Tuwongella immobilis]VIP05090.1 arginyl-trna-protein transferase : Putative arginyl-tRNA--protein transferase OS=Isosphaera pallida (strain ATCC 43644 / DSM 9630 / IS1B) GN=Isop_3091 PE=4 SV=1: ATE_N: ATE_C [Tuwongella immobilis]VTS07536.1 arginyl-trna-protein transferase : Putative arginyl-tRNA--protein transferase OS=Isosphaera pallida (strain ATCC 43644 / DSM 9630 / IS1B) GN=Isop_3091 PE=4 SV=1: ATE_N: ATE_C [Tuwongella immobilis]